MRTGMRSVGVLALVVGVLAWAPSGWADSSQGGEIVGIGSGPIKMLFINDDTNSAGTFATDSLILGFKCIVTTANSGCVLYDSATVAAGTTSNAIDDYVDPTANDVNIQLWPRPYKLTTDLSVDIISDGATAVIYYQ